MKFVTLILIVLLGGCSASPRNGKESAGGQAPDKTIRGFTLTERRGARKDRKLQAEDARLLKTEEGEFIRVSNYEMEFFEDDSPVSRLLGAEGEYDRQTEVFKASSQVQIISQERKIITSDVSWNPEEEIFTTDREVEIHTPHGVVRGIGMRASKDLNRININEKISGELGDVEVD